MQKIIELMENTEKIINEALRISLREANAARALDLFLEYIGKNSGCDRIYVFEGLHGENVKNTFEWCAEGVSSEIDNLQNVPFEAVEWWYDSFEQTGSIVIEDLEEIKEKEPLTYEYLKPQNIHSLVAAPLVLEDCILGFYGVDNPQQESLEHITNIVEIIGHFITSLLEKKRLIEKLEILSFEDSLCGVRNRHALNFGMENIKSTQNIGIIYADVLGLKRVNDKYGHKAGDALLVKVSECFKKCFRKSDIYRVGGDEFLVLCVGIQEENFLKRKEQLIEVMQQQKVEVSFGCIWRAEVTDIEELVSSADHLMYQEKRSYYARQKKESAE